MNNIITKTALRPLVNKSSQKGYTKTLKKTVNGYLIEKRRLKDDKIVSDLLVLRNGTKRYRKLGTRHKLEEVVDFNKDVRSYYEANPDYFLDLSSPKLVLKKKLYILETFLGDWVVETFDKKGKSLGQQWGDYFLKGKKINTGAYK